MGRMSELIVLFDIDNTLMYDEKYLLEVNVISKEIRRLKKMVLNLVFVLIGLLIKIY